MKAAREAGPLRPWVTMTTYISLCTRDGLCVARRSRCRAADESGLSKGMLAVEAWRNLPEQAPSARWLRESGAAGNRYVLLAWKAMVLWSRRVGLVYIGGGYSKMLLP